MPGNEGKRDDRLKFKLEKATFAAFLRQLLCRIWKKFKVAFKNTAISAFTLVFIYSVCGALFVPVNSSETRLKRPTLLYGTAKKHGVHASTTRIDRSNNNLIKQTGKVDSLFPTVKQQTTLVPLHAQKGNTVSRPLTGNLSKYELQVLAKRDITILVDKSYSMNTRDCPPVAGAIPVQNRNPGFMDKVLGDTSKFSRWQWTASHANDFSKQINGVKPDGFKLVIFSSWRQIYENVTPREVPKIFYNTKIGSGTKTATILGEQLLQYIQKRNTPGKAVKPLAIAVVTDGLPDNRTNLREIIIHITKQMKSKDEIAISFIQIGESHKGRSFLEELDNDLTKYGAKYDIVDTKTFDQVKVSGLGRSIVDAIIE